MPNRVCCRRACLCDNRHIHSWFSERDHISGSRVASVASLASILQLRCGQVMQMASDKASANTKFEGRRRTRNKMPR
jgi:hypothetical protein